MSDIKISQLARDTTLYGSDLIPFSKDLGSGKWESRVITGTGLLSSISSSRSLKVCVDGVRDADTIHDAVTLAIALNPTQSNPVAIQVLAGFYYEENPIVVPQWVSIYGEGGQYATTLLAQHDGIIFQANGNSSVDGFTIIGLSSGSNIAYKSLAQVNSSIQNCIIQNCAIGILCDNGLMNANFIVGLSLNRVIDKFVYCINGGSVSLASCGIHGIITRPTYGYYSDGADSEIHMWDSLADNCVNGLYTNNDGYIDCFSGHFDGCTYAIHLGPVGANKMRCVSTIIEESLSKDLFIESVDSSLSYVGAFDSSKFAIVEGAIVSSQSNDVNPAYNRGGGLSIGNTNAWGKMSIGTPGAVTLNKDIQVNIGEGSAFDSDQYGNNIVEFWSYKESNPSGSRFTRFVNNSGTQLTGADDAIIVGCKFNFPAIRLDINVAMVAADYITTEYWNGTSWVGLSVGELGGGVAGYRRTDFARRANKIFRDVEGQFVECSQNLTDNNDWTSDNNVLDQIPKWDANENYYAIRFRNNGALITGMQFTHGLVKPHSFMISTSGYKANFGLYRTDGSYYIDSKTFTYDAINPPTDVSIRQSKHINFGAIPSFKKTGTIGGNGVSQVSTAFTLPSAISTASPLWVYIDGLVTDTSAGNIYSTVYIARIDSKNPPVSLPIDEFATDQITPVPITGFANSFTTISQSIDISAYNDGDLLMISFARYANDPLDTYAGDFIVGDMSFKYHVKFV